MVARCLASIVGAGAASAWLKPYFAGVYQIGEV